MINLADKLTAKTVEGILADSKEIKYTKDVADIWKAELVLCLHFFKEDIRKIQDYSLYAR